MKVNNLTDIPGTLDIGIYYKTHMKESSPVLIRMAHSVTMNKNVFSNNSAVFTGFHIFFLFFKK